MAQEKDKIRVGILRGGDGEHYHISLRKGSDVISHFHEHLYDKYKPVDILVDKEGVWHIKGVPVEPSKLLYKVDVVWNLSHPRFSNILESHSVKSVGVPAFSNFFGISRKMLEDRMRKIGINMPKHLLLPAYQEDFDGPKDKYAIKKAKEVFEKFGAPWIVKSFTPDSNMGIHLAKTFDELVRGIMDGIEHEKSILVEELIPGKVTPVHSVSNFRNQDVYVFPCLPAGMAPGFSKEEKEQLISTAKNLHKHIGVEHYLKLDFVLTPRGKIYLLGMDSTPDLRQDSHFHQVCESVGTKMHKVVENILEKVL
ncbi:hypothetical protein K8Q98_00905 [Candidatus Nomurabacteria bacterium]|nr:hypothetical protein [Candidatus Nomurabacteria bacterium]